MIVTRRPTASYWLEGNSRSPQEAMVTGDCGGVREHGTFGNGSIEEPERSTVVSARSGNEQSMTFGKHHPHSQRLEYDVNATESDSEEGQTGSHGAIHLVGALADAGIPHGNVGHDEPARGQWDRRGEHRAV